MLCGFARFRELTNGRWRSELHDLLASDEHAVALFVGRGQRAVRQETEECVIPSPMQGYPLVDRLSGELVALVRVHGRAVAGLGAWVPTAAFVQRYRPGGLGITPHLDGRRFGLLVTVFTTQGSAELSIHETRSGPVVARWDAAPGSLVLLRAPGLAGIDDGRPFHAVGRPRGQGRHSVSFRMETRRG